MSEPTAPKSRYLYPGELYVTREARLISTVLGSCISVCLWDPQSGIGGMNHYLLPLWNGEGLPTPKYGNVAIPRLIDKVIDLGATRSKLQAKVFGGASMWHNPDGLLAVGERNIKLAEHMLEEARISIVSSDMGGNLGRKIFFNTENGAVLLRRNQGNLAKSINAGNDKENPPRSRR
ncbi:MAG: chemotaxis protein CheD [Desulfuromonas sp.]|nr:MAG: chemotaxis protein CheD [Desulfuromonas sp.]